MESEQALLDPSIEIDADGAHVAHHLSFRLLEREVQAALAPSAGRVGEVSRQAGLTGPRGPRYQNAAAPVVAGTPEHRVEPRDAGGDALSTGWVLQAYR